MTAETNKLVMHRFTEFINTASEKLAEELISPDAIFHVPGRPEPMRGPAGYLAIIGMMRGGFPDIQWTLRRDSCRARQGGRTLHDARYASRNLLRRPANGKENRGTGYEFLPSVRRAVCRGTRPARYAWLATANRCGAVSLNSDVRPTQGAP